MEVKKCPYFIVSDEDVDVVYAIIVTWSVGCERVREVAKGGQLLANQGLEWMGIRATSKYM
jgi:hypothetical protein